MESSINLKLIYFAVPEVSRFTPWRDMAETKANEIGYVRYGNKMFDLSIGEFQMKPSFVENLEKDLIKYGQLSFSDCLVNPKYSPTERRSIRIERLSSLKWQIRYLELFYNICSRKFSYISFNSEKHRKLFFAAAYNFGYYSDPKFIVRHIETKTFRSNVSPKVPLSYAYSAYCFYEDFACYFEERAANF
jgi:hypothetical protein